MKGLIKEERGITESDEIDAMLDSVIVPAGLKVKHYHFASYKRLCLFADLIGLKESVSLPEATLNVEKVADEKLTEVDRSNYFNKTKSYGSSC